MELDLKWPLLAFTSVLWLVLQNILNHSLNLFGMHVLLLGLVPVLPALWLGVRSGLLLMVLCACFAAAFVPMGIGFYLLMLGAGFALIHPYRVDIMRGRLPRILATAVLLNTVYFICHAIWAYADDSGGIFWLRNLTDLVISTLVLVVAGYGYLILQQSLLDLNRARPAK